MPGFLLHLQGPMQSYADTGFGQIREAGLFPSRAAVLGVIGGALGLPRSDARLVGLHDAFRVHVAVVRRGRVLKDYHTVETDAGKDKTLTWRDYHHDAHFVALVESTDEAAVAEADRALRAPVYTAFLGRRACVPGVPLLPEPGDTVEALVAAARAAGARWPRWPEAAPGARRWGAWPGETDVFLDGHVTRGDARLAFAPASAPTHGTRRDRLVAAPRAYVNRPYTRVRIPSLAAPNDRSAPAPEASGSASEDYFDAAS